MSEISSLSAYRKLAYASAWQLTKSYSTSFSLGIRLFDSSLRPHIAAIYGMVRVADEIVDSWSEIDQAKELDRFEDDCYRALDVNFSTNLILHSFAQTFNEFRLDRDLVKAFFASMRMDLERHEYDQAGYDAYIYGSAEVIGLMCLGIFTGNDKALYDELVPGARALGSAFQKVNFLRDLGADRDGLGRTYFPGIDIEQFTEAQKASIVGEICDELLLARDAILKLPRSSRRGVALAWRYYSELLTQIKATSPQILRKQRLRVSDLRKILFFLCSFLPFRTII
jgi:phytoene synthase